MSDCGCQSQNPCDCRQVSALRGKSAYEVWVLQQGVNADTSLDAFMAYMKGKTGDDGEPGVSIVDIKVQTSPVEVTPV